MKSVILIGYMGAGKSTIGKYLSQKWQIPFLDTDEWIEQKQGKTITEIFKEKGEKYFRKLETDSLEELASSLNIRVIATGGGLPLRKENQELLKQIGIVIYLMASPETILKRIKKDSTRPLLEGGEKRKKIEQMSIERHPIYSKAADICIDTDNKGIESIFNEIEEEIIKIQKLED